MRKSEVKESSVMPKKRIYSKESLINERLPLSFVDLKSVVLYGYRSFNEFYVI